MSAAARISAEGAGLLDARSPRTPHAAIAYSGGRRERDPRRTCLRLLTGVMLLAGAALLRVGLLAPRPAGRIGAAAWQAGARHGQPPRYVLVMDAGSSGTRM